MKLELFNCDCLSLDMKADCVFADPPDNIKLGYHTYKDNRPNYEHWLQDCVRRFATIAPIVWISFNARWTFAMGRIFDDFLASEKDWEGKACVQRFTFGQHNPRDLGNDHRPLWRLKRRDAPMYPDQIRVRSIRQEIGDKRANPKGRVPGDVFDFPRVTGNSAQRRAWHPTQLHEGLVERVILLSTLEGQKVFDGFAGTGTTLRVCEKLKRSCVTCDLDPSYCAEIAAENRLRRTKEGKWERKISCENLFQTSL